METSRENNSCKNGCKNCCKNLQKLNTPSVSTDNEAAIAPVYDGVGKALNISKCSAVYQK